MRNVVRGIRMKKIGIVVKVKKGVSIPNLNIDQTGWCGRITDRGIDSILGPYYRVEWDSITLQNIGFKNIYRMHKHNLDWKGEIFCRYEIVKVKERDTIEDTRKQRTIIESRINKKDNKLHNQANAKNVKPRSPHRALL